MASKPTVTLTLAGDESKLTEAFDKVGAASKEMSDKVDSSSQEMRTTGDRFDSVGEAADGAESKFMGFHDVLDGVKGGLETLSDPSASLTDKLIGLGQAGADIAGGFASFLIPALSTFWTTLTETVIPAVWSFTTALLSNPITWIVVGIVALIAILILLVTHWDAVKNVAGNVIGWIRDRWNDLMGWFGGVPGWFGRIFGAVGNAISSAFKGAINWVIDRLNWFVDRANDIIYGINVISPFNDIPNIPHIPRMHTGGVVPGMPGSEVPIMAMAGERVTANGQGGGGEFRITGNGGLWDLIQYGLRNGEVQLIDSSGERVQVA
jgi:hypothetical protein